MNLPHTPLHLSMKHFLHPEIMLKFENSVIIQKKHMNFSLLADISEHAHK